LNKNRLSIISIILSVVLLVLYVRQGKMLEDTKTRFDTYMGSVRSELECEANRASERIDARVDAANRAVRRYDDMCGVINAKEWIMEDHEVYVTLHDWESEDAQVTLLVHIGEETRSIPMEHTEDSRSYSARFDISLDDALIATFSTRTEGPSRTVEEPLEDLKVPVRARLLLTGFEGRTLDLSYEDGVLSSEIFGYLGVRGVAKAVDPVYRVYKNGELVQTVEAWLDKRRSEKDEYMFYCFRKDRMFQLECAEGDEFSIHFYCKDEVGIGYDFCFAAGVIENGQVRAEENLSISDPLLIPPE
jgi:hypothetical protein